MIAGFNTDIEFDGVVYHVQTEDKGLPSRKIISLVYDGGTILASKRTNYEDLPTGALDETAVAERVQKQHTLICAAIRAGRLEDLKAMTAKASAARSADPAPIHHEAAIVPTPIARIETQRIITIVPSDDPILAPIDDPIELPDAVVTEDFEVDEFFDAPIFEDFEIIEDDILLPADAVAVVSELSGKERPANQKLSIELLGDAKFKGGDRITVSLMICRGTERKVVADAQIMVKVLGSSFRPVIFHAKTDSNGMASVHLQMPRFSSGRAALLLRASHNGEEIELRRVVLPG